MRSTPSHSTFIYWFTTSCVHTLSPRMWSPFLRDSNSNSNSNSRFKNLGLQSLTSTQDPKKFGSDSKPKIGLQLRNLWCEDVLNDAQRNSQKFESKNSYFLLQSYISLNKTTTGVVLPFEANSNSNSRPESQTPGGSKSDSMPLYNLILAKQ